MVELLVLGWVVVMVVGLSVSVFCGLLCGGGV